MRDKGVAIRAERVAPRMEDALEDAVDLLTRRMERFREAFLSALDGHSTERVAAYIKENYLKNVPESTADAAADAESGRRWKNEE